MNNKDNKSVQIFIIKEDPLLSKSGVAVWIFPRTPLPIIWLGLGLKVHFTI